MAVLNISINNKVATFHKRGGGVVCRNTDYVIAFTFDSEWEGYENKTARFIWGGRYQDVPIEGTTCVMPEVYRTESVKVGVYAGDLSTTTPAVIPCQASVLCEADEPHDEEARPNINEAKEAAEKATQAAEAAAEAAAAADVAATTAQEAADVASEAAATAAQAAGNPLIGEKSGATVVLDDISPVEHDIKATASSKNICDNVFESGGITSDTGVEGVNKTTVRSVNYIPIKPNTTYTIKAYNFTGNIRFRFYAENKVYIGYKFPNVPNGNAFTFKSSSDSYFVRFDILETNTDILLQLEEGAVATTYTPYVNVSETKAKVYGEGSSYIEHPIAVDGTIEGLKSLYPTVSIVSDTEGVVFYAKYNRDINKAFAELQQAIISLGGNV